MDTPVKKPNANRQKKEVIVAEVLEKVTKAKAMVFANYQGMTHKQLEELKKALKKVDSELVVTKNTLLKIALKKEHADAITLDLPTVTLFAYNDVVSPIKELAKVIKLLNLPKIKFGILAGKQVTEKDVMRLSTLPTREVLLSQLVGNMKSPLYGLHRALNWNLQRFVMTLKAIETKKRLAYSFIVKLDALR